MSCSAGEEKIVLLVLVNFLFWTGILAWFGAYLTLKRRNHMRSGQSCRDGSVKYNHLNIAHVCSGPLRFPSHVCSPAAEDIQVLSPFRRFDTRRTLRQELITVKEVERSIHKGLIIGPSIEKLVKGVSEPRLVGTRTINIARIHFRRYLMARVFIDLVLPSILLVDLMETQRIRPDVNLPLSGQGLDGADGAVGPFPVRIHFVQAPEADLEASHGLPPPDRICGLEVEQVDDGRGEGRVDC
jgi:hypothetical protein